MKVESKALSGTVLLTGESFRIKRWTCTLVQGFVEKVLVDRGSMVKQGELLVILSAPEMEAQVAEGEAKVKRPNLRHQKLGQKL